LAAWFRQGVNKVAAEFEQACFKNSKQTYGSSADNDDVCLNHDLAAKLPNRCLGLVINITFGVAMVSRISQ